MSIRDSFSDIYGLAPDLISAAPGRVNLIGEHVDYNDGFVLPFAIEARTYCALRIREDSRIRIASKQEGGAPFETDIASLKALTGPIWTRYILGVIWALDVKSGLEILIDSEVPTGAGLSSSAALECSVAVALNEILDLDISLADLARITQRAENEFVGVPCGIMDQSVSLMAHSGSALLLDCRDLSTRHIGFDVASSGLELLIIDTQTHHSLTDGGYAERRASCESVVAKLGITSLRELSLNQLESSHNLLTKNEFLRAKHAVTEMQRVMDAVIVLENKDFASLGLLLNQSHTSLRDDYNVSCPELNCAVDASISAGALGARMVGGGFGGTAIALINASHTKETITAVEKAFADNRFKAPRFFTSLPSQGAEIIQRG